jgi:hypothetical protein
VSNDDSKLRGGDTSAQKRVGQGHLGLPVKPQLRNTVRDVELDGDRFAVDTVKCRRRYASEHRCLFPIRNGPVEGERKPGNSATDQTGCFSKPSCSIARRGELEGN